MLSYRMEVLVLGLMETKPNQPAEHQYHALWAGGRATPGLGELS